MLHFENTMISRYLLQGGTVTNALKFVASTWLTSFITAAYCQYEKDQNERLISCKYFEKNNGRSCNQMEFIIDGSVFEYGAQQFTHLTEINLTVGHYIVETEHTDEFYLCKQIYNPTAYYYDDRCLLIIFSMVFLFFHIILNFNKGYFKIWQNQLLFFYSIGLMVMYVLFMYIYLQYPASNIPFNIAKIFWTNHFLWTSLILTVFCHEAFGMGNRSENVTEGIPRLKSDLLILFSLFGSALTICLPLIYLIFLEKHKNQCPSIPGHLGVPDEPAENADFLTLIVFLSLFFFMPVIVVVGIVCVLSDFKNAPCDPEETRRAVLAKMLSFVGVHLILYHGCRAYYRDKNSSTVFGRFVNIEMMAQLSIDYHGVLVFFVFFIHRRMLLVLFLLIFISVLVVFYL